MQEFFQQRVKDLSGILRRSVTRPADARVVRDRICAAAMRRHRATAQ
jgi:hypothetical protein